MTAPNSVDVAAVLRQQVAEGQPDVLRTMVAAFANALMSADADAICGADYGQRSEERSNRRNGYRTREWDTRAGTVELQIPKLRQGSYFPDWLLTHRRRAEQALVTVVATSYLLGVSTRRVEKLAEQLGVTRLSKSQVSEMATHLDAQVEARIHLWVHTTNNRDRFLSVTRTMDSGDLHADVALKREYLFHQRQEKVVQAQIERCQHSHRTVAADRPYERLLRRHA